MASAATMPSGMAICCSIPDMLFLPELVFGGLVWILVACTYVNPANPQGYVMAVSLFCFCLSFIWMMVFLCGSHNNKSSWAAADMLYHGLAAILYLSASVLLALVTIGWGKLNAALNGVSDGSLTGALNGVSGGSLTGVLNGVSGGSLTGALGGSLTGALNGLLDGSLTGVLAEAFNYFGLLQNANIDILKMYRLDISAVVFSFITTLLYTIHTIFSGIRWKSF